jgi:hypothetical protein
LAFTGASATGAAATGATAGAATATDSFLATFFAEEAGAGADLEAVLIIFVAEEVWLDILRVLINIYDSEASIFKSRVQILKPIGVHISRRALFF